jgi:hypothetical protein
MNFAHIQRELDYYKKFTPINFPEERTRFFEHFEKKKPYNPVFNYSDTLTVRDYEDIKDSLKKERDTDLVINNLSISHIISELIYNFILIIATAQAQTSSFYETFQVIYKLGQDKNFSFSAAYKAKRGFQDTAQPGCFQKQNENH